MTVTIISGIVVFVLFTGIGIYLLNKSLTMHGKSKTASKWPTVTATILESDMTEDPGRNAMGGVNLNYLITVKYEYTVAGKVHQGDRVTIGNPSFNFITASSVSDQFAVDNKVPVYYNPNNPEESVLAPKTTVGMLSWVPGVFFIVVGFVIGFISLFM